MTHSGQRARSYVIATPNRDLLNPARFTHSLWTGVTMMFGPICSESEACQNIHFL